MSIYFLLIPKIGIIVKQTNKQTKRIWETVIWKSHRMKRMINPLLLAILKLLSLQVPDRQMKLIADLTGFWSWTNLMHFFVNYFYGDHYVRCGISVSKEGDRLLSRVYWDMPRWNGFKLKEGRFRLDIKKRLFMIKVVKHWNRLPKEVVDVPSLETFKLRLDEAQSTLIQL